MNDLVAVVVCIAEMHRMGATGFVFLKVFRVRKIAKPVARP